MLAPEVAAVRASVAAVLARHGRRRIDVAFSGGPDSTVLADAAIAGLGTGAVRLLHVDHRVAASAAAVAHVQAWAAARAVALEVVAIDVPAGPSWEAQARGARDRALAALAGDELCATGHTASDQAETVLLRLVRGTGPDGLAAIAPRRGPFIRPLLAHVRAEVAAYVDALGLAPWHDPMNDDPAFTRVWLRQQIIPALAARNPAVERALARVAALAADDRAALAPAVAEVAAAAADGDDLACAPLATAPPALARRVIAAWLAGHGASHELAAVAAVLDLARAPTAGTRGLDLGGGRVERIYDRLVIAGGASHALPRPLRVLGPDGPYQIRPWRPGDRMRPARLRGASRKLSDLYGDLKLARAHRAVARVVVDAAEVIVWAEHVGAAWQATVVVRADLPE